MSGDHDHPEVWAAVEGIHELLREIAEAQRLATAQILAIADVTATNTAAIAELRGV